MGRRVDFAARAAGGIFVEKLRARYCAYHVPFRSLCLSEYRRRHGKVRFLAVDSAAGSVGGRAFLDGSRGHVVLLALLGLSRCARSLRTAQGKGRQNSRARTGKESDTRFRNGEAAGGRHGGADERRTAHGNGGIIIGCSLRQGFSQHTHADGSIGADSGKVQLFSLSGVSA